MLLLGFELIKIPQSGVFVVYILWSLLKIITDVLKLEISNRFSEWEIAFYDHQPIARAAGIFEIYHGHEPDNEHQVCVILHALREQHIQKFMEANSTAIAASGQILESTNSAIHLN
mgnify:CR=1 FL=1